MSDQLTLAVVGAGNRGNAYARIAAADPRARVVAVAEPDPVRRRRFAEEHDLPPERVYADWRDLAASERLADAVMLTTQDAMHHDPAVALVRRGYHLLLEKPMATTEQDARSIVAAAEIAGVTLAVCHVMRYTAYTAALSALISRGDIGDVVSVEHLEPVGWWHHAHSFVRGNWRREDTATFMLMAKSVHDIDWLDFVVGRPAERVSSFGGLYHFRPDQKPDGAADRCLDCAVESTCPYSAVRLYPACLGDPERERWPLSTITDDLTHDGVMRALREGPYGRCVYSCDNDVVDHQVVSIEYAGGVTASFTMTAFSPHEARRTRVFGTHGYVEGDGRELRVLDFRTSSTTVIDTADGGAADAAGGHGGGDAGLMTAFIDTLLSGVTAVTDPRESLRSHRLTWAAERARRTGTVVEVDT